MSDLLTRNALLTELISQIDSAKTHFGFNIGRADQGVDFNPEGFDMWVAWFYVPVTKQSNTKLYNGVDDNRGFLQVSVYIKQNDAILLNQQLEFFDILAGAFWSGAEFNNVYISESVINGGRNSDAWFVRDMTINYLTFTSRG